MGRTTPRRRNVFTHLTVAVVVPACLALCWWQVTRAVSGNTLSWAYVFEWPIFAGYAVFMWWKLIHEPTPAPPADGHVRAEESTPEGGPVPGPDPAEDEELASYNRYLAALHASGKRKQW